MPQDYTIVIPIHNFELNSTVSQEFGGGLRLAALPAWVPGQQMLNELSRRDRKAVEEATHALALTYPAESLGSPDPDWRGPEPKSIQEAKYEIGLMANFALWLTKPSPLCFFVVLRTNHQLWTQSWKHAV